MLESNTKIKISISICQKPSERVPNSPQLIISLKSITMNFEYALKSTDRSKHIFESVTHIMGHPAHH